MYYVLIRFKDTARFWRCAQLRGEVRRSMPGESRTPVQASDASIGTDLPLSADVGRLSTRAGITTYGGFGSEGVMMTIPLRLNKSYELRYAAGMRSVTNWPNCCI